MDTWDKILAELERILSGTYESPDAMAAELAPLYEAMQALIGAGTASDATEEQASEALKQGRIAMLKFTQIETKIKAKRELSEMKAKADAAVENVKTVGATPSGMVIKDGARITGKAYTGKGFKAYGNDAGKAAYVAGRQIAAAFGLDDTSVQWCKDNNVDIRRKTQSSLNDALGGLLVVDELDTAIRFYREERGVARANMEVMSMNSENKRFNRNVGGTNVYAVGQGQTVTLSDVQFDGVNVTASKFMAITNNNIELAEDGYASIAEEVAKDHGYAHAVKEDAVAFLGDGTSTYNGNIGLVNAFKKLVTDAGGTFNTDADKAYAVSIKAATGATLASVTDADIIATVAKVATFNGMRKVIYTPSDIYWNVLVKLARAAGGITATEIINGQEVNTYAGIPVVFIESLYDQFASAENNNLVLAVGSMTDAGIFGDRKGLSFTTSQEVGFLTEQEYQKSVARYGVNWWNIGTGSATASLRKRGSLAALFTKNA